MLLAENRTRGGATTGIQVKLRQIASEHASL
jgi:hypothetical protein